MADADAIDSNPPPNVTATQSPTPIAADVEKGADTEAGVSNIVRRWKREDLVKRGSLISRGLGFVFSFLAFVLMASNRHGDWMNFDRYEEYRYLLAISILSSLYTGLQSARQIHELYTNKQIISWKKSAIADFLVDQTVGYLLISAASSAIPLTNRMRLGSDNIFTDTSASAIAMEFMAFVSIAISAVISGYKLSDGLYI